MTEVGKLLIGVGVLLVVVGGVLVLSGSLGDKVPVGRLPGDIHVQRGNWSFCTSPRPRHQRAALLLAFLARR
jgi:hypothetical protein